MVAARPRTINPQGTTLAAALLIGRCDEAGKPRHPHDKQVFGVLTPPSHCLTGETSGYV